MVLKLTREIIEKYDLSVRTLAIIW